MSQVPALRRMAATTQTESLRRTAATTQAEPLIRMAVNRGTGRTGAG